MLPERGPSRLAAWGAGSLVVALLHNRLWATFNLAFFTAVSRNLGHNPFGNGFDGDYLLTNLTGPTLARLLHQTEPHQYARLHLIVLLLGLAAVIVVAFRRFGYEVARLLCVLVAASPALTVCMEWLGQPDALTFPLALGIVVARRRPAAFALAVLLGLTHAEQGLIAALVGTVVRLVVVEAGDDDPIRRRISIELVTLVGGIAVGRAITELYLRVNDIVITTPRTSFLDLGVSGFLDHHLQSHGLIVYALWGPLWIGIAVVAIRFVKSGAKWPTALRRQWLLLGAAAAVAVLPMLATLDETRVYSLTTAPLLVGAAVLSRRTLTQVDQARLTGVEGTNAVVATAAAAVLLAASPGVFTAGKASFSYELPGGEFARFLVDGEVPPDHGDLTQWLMSPFDFTIPSTN